MYLSEILKEADDFQNLRQEWRRFISEFVGTFFLVLVAAGVGMVMAIIMFMGRVSGAHLNPGVSVAFALRGDFP